MVSWLGRQRRSGRHRRSDRPWVFDAPADRGPAGRGKAASGPARFILRVLAISGLALILVGLFTGAALYVVLKGLSNPTRFVSLAEAVPGTRINVLVLGLDAPLNAKGKAVPDFDVRRATGSRSDTMMLVSIDPEAEEVSLLSLPRDTRCVIVGREGEGHDKLAHAHAYGGPDMAIATVSRLLGIPIHYYVRVNSAGAARIIDLLGGVEIYVERDMHYHDTAQNLYIDIDQGLQVLDGEKAVGYMRYRGGLSDIDRIERQQKLLRALKERVFRLGTIARLPSLVDQVTDMVDTNMTPGEMIYFARLAAKMESVEPVTAVLPGEIRTVEEPGSGPRSYWIMDPEAAAEAVERLLWGVDPLANAEITVEVLNGTGVPGLAAGFAEELRRQGYAVAGVGDAAPGSYPKTEIIDRSRDADKLRRISQAVLRYLPGAVLGSARPTDGRPQFTVIIGLDYAALVSSGDQRPGG